MEAPGMASSPQSLPPQFPPGTRIASYEVSSLLGVGGMGEVYLARDLRLQRDVAIKVLPETWTRDSERIARFRHEALLLASLNHPNIATIHALEPAGEIAPMIVLEYVPGETLADRIATESLGLEHVIRIGIQVAEALEAAHEKGVIHRDLKPGNIVLSSRGPVKVLDFGIAQGAVETASDDDRTMEAAVPAVQERALAGSPGYMSPEQIRGEPQNHRTDLFSFGCVLFECITGRRAFDGRNAAERMRATLDDEPAWPRSPVVDSQLRELVTACLQKEPASRPATMGAVREALQARLGTGTAPAAPGSATTSALRHNFPAGTTRFIGRDRELQEAEAVLGASRLITFTGVGGCGKTRLACELVMRVIERFPDGAWFINLAPLAEGSHVVTAAADALAVREVPGRPLMESVIEHLRSRTSLLVLDNCEHVLTEAAAFSADALAACGALRIVATSREPLGVSGEQSVRVPSLGVPGAKAAAGTDTILASESVQLFIERARLVDNAFRPAADNAAALGEICRRLDGIPLAIELAAARVRVLGIEQIRRMLDDRFRLLTGGRTSIPRQQTLRGAIQWSHDLLHEDEKRLFRRFAVFAGGWTLEAAVAVADESSDEFAVIDSLTRLIDKSLVGIERSDGSARYRMLETIRQYAVESMMNAGDGAAARDRHLAFYRGFVRDASAGIEGPEQARWLEQLETDQENVRAAIQWALENDPETALEMAASLSRFWWIRGHFSVGRDLLARAIAHAPEVRGKVGVRTRLGAAELAFRSGDFEGARRLLEEALELGRTLEDPLLLASTLQRLGTMEGSRGNLGEARPHLERALMLYRDARHRPGIAATLNNLALVASESGDLEGARVYFEDSLAIKRELGDRLSVLGTLNNVGTVEQLLGNFECARSHYEESVNIARELGHMTALAHGLMNIATLCLDDGLLAEARRCIEESLAISREIGNRPVEVVASIKLGRLLLAEGDARGARESWEGAVTLCREVGSRKDQVEVILALGSLALHEGDRDSARRHFAEGLSMVRTAGDPGSVAMGLEGVARVQLAIGNDAEATRLMGAAAAILKHRRMASGSAEKAVRESTIHDMQNRLGMPAFEQAWRAGEELPMDEAIARALSL